MTFKRTNFFFGQPTYSQSRSTPDLKEGDRIALIRMGADDPDPIEPGTEGTVLFVSELGIGEYQIVMNWDNGRKLNLCVPPDRYRKVS